MQRNLDPEQTQDLAAQHFLQLLMWLRSVLLQDLALLVDLEPDVALWKHAAVLDIIQHPEWDRFKQVVQVTHAYIGDEDVFDYMQVKPVSVWLSAGQSSPSVGFGGMGKGRCRHLSLQFLADKRLLGAIPRAQGGARLHSRLQGAGAERGEGHHCSDAGKGVPSPPHICWLSCFTKTDIRHRLGPDDLTSLRDPHR